METKKTHSEFLARLATFRRKNSAPRRGDFLLRAGISCTIVPDLIA
jgi:hypothetical protein